MVAKSFYYPLSDLIGSETCLIYHFLELSYYLFMEMHSFFIATYRYLCIIHNESLLKLGLDGKMLAKRTVLTMLILPLLLETFIFSDANYSPLNSCLGKFFLNFDSNGIAVCPNGNFTCYLSHGVAVALSSNIFEVYFLFKCFKASHDQTEKVASMIGRNELQKRHRQAY